MQRYLQRKFDALAKEMLTKYNLRTSSNVATFAEIPPDLICEDDLKTIDHHFEELSLALHVAFVTCQLKTDYCLLSIACCQFAATTQAATTSLKIRVSMRTVVAARFVQTAKANSW